MESLESDREDGAFLSRIQTHIMENPKIRQLETL